MTDILVVDDDEGTRKKLTEMLEVVRDALDRDPSMQVEGDADLVAAELERGES